MKPSQCSHLPTPAKCLCDSVGALQHPEVRWKHLAHNCACDGTSVASRAAFTAGETPACAVRCSRAVAHLPASWDRQTRCVGKIGRGRRLPSHSISEAGLHPTSSPGNKTSDGPD